MDQAEVRDILCPTAQTEDRLLVSRGSGLGFRYRIRTVTVRFSWRTAASTCWPIDYA